MATWTQSLDLRWRPEPTFFDVRSKILLGIRDQGLLDAFAWQESEIDIRLAQFETIQVGPSHLTVNLTSPKATSESVVAATALALELVEPQDMIVAQIRLACLEELDGDPLEAQRLYADLASTPWLPSTRGIDAALLVDGFSDQTNSQFKVEFGIVSRGEVPVRLNRSAGRIGSAPMEVQIARSMGMIASGQVNLDLDLADVPESAVFMDWLWVPGRPVVSLSEITSTWQAVVKESDRLGQNIRERLSMGTASEKGDIG
jgi:hypothetical protein